MVEELGVGSWVAETRCGRSEGQVSLVYSVLGGSAMQGEVRYIPGAGAGAHSRAREATRRCRTLATSQTGGS